MSLKENFSRYYYQARRKIKGIPLQMTWYYNIHRTEKSETKTISKVIKIPHNAFLNFCL